jgi:hypothetical protein
VETSGSRSFADVTSDTHRWATRLTTIAWLMVVVSLIVSTSAGAQSSERTGFRLVGLDVIALDGSGSLRVSVPDDTEPLDVIRVAVHPVVSDLADFDTQTDDEVITRIEPRIQDLEVTNSITRVPLELGRESGQLRILDEGVYPIDVSLRRGREERDLLRTWLVIGDEPPPRLVTIVARIAGTPTVDSDDSISLLPAHREAFDALDRLARVAPVTADISGLLLELGPSLPDQLTLAASTAVPIESSPLLLDESEFRHQVDRFSTATQLVGRVVADDAPWIAPGVDDGLVASIANAGGRVVIDPQQTDAPPRRQGPVTVITPTSRTDELFGITDALAGAELTARRVLEFGVGFEPVDLIVLDLLGPDRDRINDLTERLRNDTSLQVVSFARAQPRLITDALATAQVGGSTLDAAAIGRRDAIAALRSRLNSLTAVDPSASDLHRTAGTLLDLAPALPEAFDRASDVMVTLRDVVDPLADDDLSGGRTISITLTLQRRTPNPVNVLVTATATGSRLRIKEQTQQFVALGATERVIIELEAVTSGRSSVTVDVRTPDGLVSLLPQPATIEVRSYAVSGVGVALSVGAALLLGLWWIKHLRDRGRSVPSRVDSSGD